MRNLIKIQRVFAALFLGFLTIPAVATTYYVDINSANPTPPYTSWSTASTDIQSAIDESTNGDLVLVNDGVYQTGGETVNGYDLTNRVVIDKAITVESVNGPALTAILGFQDTNSIVADDAIRCVYLTNDAVLSGFTLTNGATLADGDPNAEQSGGGVWCESTNALVTNCVITADAANNFAGGAFSATLVNCALSNNLSFSAGGGAAECVLNGCVLAGNTANDDYFQGAGGGAFASTLTNCVLTNNYALVGGGAESSAINDCTLGGNGALANGGGADSSTLNQCCLIGNQVGVFGIASTVDDRISGTGPLLIIPDTGGGAANSELTNCTLTGNQAVGYAVGGGVDSSTLEDCFLATNIAGNNGGGANNSTLTDCILTNNNAAYSGGGAEGGTLFNCTLTGNSAANNGGGADSSTLYNCLITNNMAPQWNGGGVSGGFLNNCTLIGNLAGQAGGGAFESTVTNCLLASNTVAGGGGGGAYGGELDRCMVIGNIALDSGGGTGGGACFSTVNNSLFTGNYADMSGGGAMYGTLNNCTVAGNSAAVSGGGAGDGNLNNCIVFDNTAPSMPNFVLDGEVAGVLNYCCIPDVPAGADGAGNVTNAPAFVDWTNNDFHLESNSPCINAGNNAYVAAAADLDGNPRIVGGTVDIGAYEFQTPASVISYAYLQQYGLPTDGSVDFTDLDGTGFNVYQDWIAGLDPTNSASVLVMLPPSPTNNTAGITVSWQSVSGINYNLQRSSDLSAQPAFSTIQSNIVGNAGTTSYIDTSATNSTPYFYRVGVQAP